MIVEYWFRKLIALSIATEDISKIILNFAKIYDAFIGCSDNTSTEIENEGLLMVKKNDDNIGTVFGTVTAKPGKGIYHWRLKIIECDHKDINLGIVEANKCDEITNNRGWWGEDYGYSYWSGDGEVFHNNDFHEYGDAFGQDDVIDIWLDMDQDQRELSFAKNDTRYGRAYQVKESTEYKLAITVYGDGYIIELMSFELC